MDISGHVGETTQHQCRVSLQCNGAIIFTRKIKKYVDCIIYFPLDKSNIDNNQSKPLYSSLIYKYININLNHFAVNNESYIKHHGC